MIEESVFGCEGCSRAAGRALHLVQRHLKSDDVCVALGAITNPDSHQAVQVTRADAAMSGHVSSPHAPVLTLDCLKRCGDDVVQTRILEPPQQKALKHVNAPFGRVRARFARDEIMKGSGSAQPDPATDNRMRGNPAQKEGDAWTQSDADQQSR